MCMTNFVPAPSPPPTPVPNACPVECSRSLPCTSPNTPDIPVSNKPNNKTEHNPAHAQQDGLLNLSKHDLSGAEISVLKKGLSFVPTP